MNYLARQATPSARSLDPRRLTLSLLLVLSLLSGLRAPQAVVASEGEKAVRRGTSPVWVESDGESVTVPSRLLNRGDYSDRHDSILKDSGRSDWDRWFDQLWSPWTGNSSFSDFFSSLFKLWQLGILILLAILLGYLLYLFFRSEAFRTFLIQNRSRRGEEALEQQRAKVSDLPFEIEQPIIGLLAQAERLRNQGDYSQAIVYLYSYLLVELDHAHCIRLERGKTNGAYVRELHPWNALSTYMHSTVRLFELVYFGRRQIDRDAFEGVWNKVADVEDLLSRIRSGRATRDSDASPALASSSTASDAGASF